MTRELKILWSMLISVTLVTILFFNNQLQSYALLDNELFKIEKTSLRQTELDFLNEYSTRLKDNARAAFCVDNGNGLTFYIVNLSTASEFFPSSGKPFFIDFPNSANQSYRKMSFYYNADKTLLVGNSSNSNTSLVGFRMFGNYNIYRAMSNCIFKTGYCDSATLAALSNWSVKAAKLSDVEYICNSNVYNQLAAEIAAASSKSASDAAASSKAASDAAASSKAASDAVASSSSKLISDKAAMGYNADTLKPLSDSFVANAIIILQAAICILSIILVVYCVWFEVKKYSRW